MEALTERMQQLAGISVNENLLSFSQIEKIAKEFGGGYTERNDPDRKKWEARAMHGIYSNQAMFTFPDKDSVSDFKRELGSKNGTVAVTGSPEKIIVLT